MNSVDNKEKIAIIVVGYNRLYSLQRLISSLEKATYEVDSVPLVISIDASGDEDLYNWARNYEWRYGRKYVIIQKERLGLKRHIFACADLTKYFKGIILLEDDLFVSPYFYHYVQSALNYYKDDVDVACIGLYSYASNIYSALPFTPFQTDYDVYGIQSTITWGECWNERMWNDFKEWLSSNEPIQWDAIDIPTTVKQYKRAWSKYFTAYMAETHRFVIVPYKSYVTNYTEAGEHSNETSTCVQVPYVRRKELIKCGEIERLIKYDSFFNPIGLEDYLQVPQNDLCVDLFSTRPNNRNCRYILTTDILPFRVVRTFGLKTRPIETNVIDNIAGVGIYLYDLTMADSSNKQEINTIESIQYRLQMFRPRLLYKYTEMHMKTVILRRIKSLFKCKNS